MSDSHRGPALTGIARIDGQHRHLFALIETVHDILRRRSGNSSVRPVLTELQRYVAEHFRDEEKMLAGVEYPGANEQRTRHREFEAKLEEWKTMADVANVPLPLFLYRFLHDWLTAHIQGEDMEYARWIASRRRAA